VTGDVTFLKNLW